MILLPSLMVSNSNVVRIVAMASAEHHTLSITFVKKLAKVSLWCPSVTFTVLFGEQTSISVLKRSKNDEVEVLEEKQQEQNG